MPASPICRPSLPSHFSCPYTAEEMALRAMEFPHSPFWDCILIDMAFSVTNSGFMDQRVTLIPILYFPENGFGEHLYAAQPGQEIYRWLSQGRLSTRTVRESDLMDRLSDG